MRIISRISWETILRKGAGESMRRLHPILALALLLPGLLLGVSSCSSPTRTATTSVSIGQPTVPPVAFFPTAPSLPTIQPLQIGWLRQKPSTPPPTKAPRILVQASSPVTEMGHPFLLDVELLWGKNVGLREIDLQTARPNLGDVELLRYSTFPSWGWSAQLQGSRVVFKNTDPGGAPPEDAIHYAIAPVDLALLIQPKGTGRIAFTRIDLHYTDRLGRVGSFSQPLNTTVAVQNSLEPRKVVYGGYVDTIFQIGQSSRKDKTYYLVQSSDGSGDYALRTTPGQVLRAWDWLPTLGIVGRTEMAFPTDIYYQGPEVPILEEGALRATPLFPPPEYNAPDWTRLAVDPSRKAIWIVDPTHLLRLDRDGRLHSWPGQWGMHGVVVDLAAVGPNGDIWLANNLSLTRFDPTTGKSVSFSVPTVHHGKYGILIIEGLTVDRTGMVWASFDTSSLYRLDPHSGKWRRFPLPAAVSSGTGGPFGEGLWTTPEGKIQAVHIRKKPREIETITLNPATGRVIPRRILGDGNFYPVSAHPNFGLLFIPGRAWPVTAMGDSTGYYWFDSIFGQPLLDHFNPTTGRFVALLLPDQTVGVESGPFRPTDLAPDPNGGIDLAGGGAVFYRYRTWGHGGTKP